MTDIAKLQELVALRQKRSNRAKARLAAAMSDFDRAQRDLADADQAIVDQDREEAALEASLLHNDTPHMMAQTQVAELHQRALLSNERRVLLVLGVAKATHNIDVARTARDGCREEWGRIKRSEQKLTLLCDHMSKGIISREELLAEIEAERSPARPQFSR